MIALTHYCLVSPSSLYKVLHYQFYFLEAYDIQHYFLFHMSLGQYYNANTVSSDRTLHNAVSDLSIHCLRFITILKHFCH